MEYKPIIDAEALRPHYKRTLSGNRILLTAHSHRAWPDRITAGQAAALDLAFEDVDQKWDRIFTYVIPEFQAMVAERIGCDRPDLIANGENCHELVTRVLSCFPWDASTHVVTTDAEFHSTKRQLYRLEEEGVRVDYVPTGQKGGLTDRIIAAIVPGADVAIVSSVFFNEGYVLQDAERLARHCRENGTVLLLDAYHHFNVRSLDADRIGRDIFITAGGYKYSSAGEGAAWLKVPEDCELRPRITGWFADFASLAEPEYPRPVRYGPGAQRFLGATRDLSGICRQIEVFRFMEELGMTVHSLQENNLHQTAYLMHLFDVHGLADKEAAIRSSADEAERGPFLAIDLNSAARAGSTARELMSRHGVWTDTRGSIIRFGPAPYTTQSELETAMSALAEVISG